MLKRSTQLVSKTQEFATAEGDGHFYEDLPRPLVFVTVGTTKFDCLVSTITQEDTLNALKERGYKSLVLQIGTGTVLPNEENCKNANIHLHYYRLRNSIKEDILRADLIISHGGAGTSFEVLAEKKPLIVVVNENLMDNHQTELAEKLSSENYLFACTCRGLVAMIKTMQLKSLKKMPPPCPTLLQEYLDQFMNIVAEK